MRILLSGGANSGKSALGQRLALDLAAGGRRYYVATMIPTGREDETRIRRHLEARAGLGFETVECFRDLRDLLRTADPAGTFLVDSVTALMQNALFPAEQGYRPDPEAARRCIRSLTDFAGQVRHAVFVSDFLCADGADYDAGTETYRRCLAQADRQLAAVCDTVAEVAAGQWIVYKGALWE